MSNKELTKKCRELPLSGISSITDDAVSDTVSCLEPMWNLYKYSEILGTLSDIWPVHHAAEFFGRSYPLKHDGKSPHTIGTLCFNLYNGGIQRVQAQLICIWHKMGYRIVLLTDEPANNLDYHIPDGVTRITIPDLNSIARRLDAIQNAISEYKIDILVNNSWLNYSIVWEAALAHMMGIPYIQHTHSHYTWPYRFGSSALYMTRSFKVCDLVIALSASDSKFYQLCGCHTYHVHNPVPEDIRQIRETAPLTSGHILVVGWILPEKRTIDAIHIFKKVHDTIPDTVLDIVGDGPVEYKEKVQKCCESLGLNDSVIFHGKVPQEDVNRFIYNSSVLLFTSELEGYGMVLLESMAYGLPIVMYNLPYLSLVSDNNGIFSSPIGEIRQMADNIIRLLRDKDLRLYIGKEARKCYDKVCDYDIEQAWSDIFHICTNSEGQTIKSVHYYDPDLVPVDERVIEPDLLNAFEKGLENELKQNLDYRLGHKMLVIPRKIKKMLHLT